MRHVETPAAPSPADGRMWSGEALAGVPSGRMSDFLGDTRDLLRRTPDVLRALLTGLPDTWTATPDVADGWRPRDVVGHLISGELDDWIPRPSGSSSTARARPSTRLTASPTWSATSTRRSTP